MGYQIENHEAVGNGGAGTPEAWDIITDLSHDLDDKIVCAFMNLLSDDGSFTEMKEEVVPARANKAMGTGTSEDVAAKYLTYAYPQNIIFEGRYTTLVPGASCQFKVWFLK
jgi:hypothetical protein